MSLLLLRIASWTNARFDQHLRDEIGDEDADAVLRAFAALGVLPPECDPSGRIRASVPVVVKVENPSDKPAVFQGTFEGTVAYKQVERPVRKDCLVDGERVTLDQVLKDPDRYPMTTTLKAEVGQVREARSGDRITLKGCYGYGVEGEFYTVERAGVTLPSGLSRVEVERDYPIVVWRSEGPKPKPSCDNPHAALSETLRELHGFVEMLDKEHHQRASSDPLDGRRPGDADLFARLRVLASTMCVYATIVREISDFDRLAFEALTADVRLLEEYTGLRMARERHQREQDARRTTPADKESP